MVSPQPDPKALAPRHLLPAALCPVLSGQTGLLAAACHSSANPEWGLGGGAGGVTRDNGHQLVLLGGPSFPLLPMGHKSKREMSGGETKGKAVRLTGLASNNALRTALRSARLRGPCGKRVPQSQRLRWERVGLGLTGAGSGQGTRYLGSVQGGAEVLLSLPFPDLFKSHPGPASVGWGLGFCISNQPPGNAAAAAQALHSELSVG